MAYRPILFLEPSRLDRVRLGEPPGPPPQSRRASAIRPAASHPRTETLPHGRPVLGVAVLAGGTTTLGEYAGKLLLIVNTANECGLLDDAGLEKLYQTLRTAASWCSRFPMDQFGAVVPGSAEHRLAFCARNYGAAFRCAKIEVNSDGAHPWRI